ncbi:hypothetical protein ACFP1Z_14110 [Streptomyces gamaensis]|uniref:ATP-grasp fold RimK-type domain-containing protein n=1 Tax=Streptomyces gamaensis TaxID=1763542 RepID=A0ABW0YYR1_9ACTN
MTPPSFRDGSPLPGVSMPGKGGTADCPHHTAPRRRPRRDQRHRLLAAEVRAGSEQAHVDWRSDYRSLTYRATRTPDGIAESVRRLMRRLELRFAALDFVVSPSGEWTFLEANPCGQWDWIQHATGLPIAEAIADELTGAAA